MPVDRTGARPDTTIGTRIRERWEARYEVGQPGHAPGRRATLKATAYAL